MDSKIFKLFTGCILIFTATTSYSWMCPVVKHNGDEVRPSEAQPEGHDKALKCEYAKGHACIYEKVKSNKAVLDKNRSSKKFSCASNMH